MWPNIESIPIWDSLNQNLMNYYAENFIKNDFEIVDHTGTFLCVGIGEHDREGTHKKNQFRQIDRKDGFIIKYGQRLSWYDKKTNKINLGREKGVDTEIVCQMLMGAFLNHYDSCILLSDDGDYVPVIERVQDYFGKKVIQAGFLNVPLRNKSYAHIPFENADEYLANYI